MTTSARGAYSLFSLDIRENEDSVFLICWGKSSVYMHYSLLPLDDSTFCKKFSNFKSLWPGWYDD